MPPIIQSYCIGHTPPVFTPPVPFTMLCPKALGTASEIVIDDHRFGEHIDGSSLAEYSQLFVLAKMIEAGDIAVDKLFLFQYRKFLSPLPDAGVPANAPWTRVLRTGNAAAAFPSLGTLQELPSRLIVGSLQDLGNSISGNYALAHVIEDLVMFSAACATTGQVSQADVRSLATLHGIIPSPALCYTDAALFVRTMGILEAVWNEFSTHYHVKREGYQRRVAGYLLERLHSVLLCKWLMDGSEPDIHLWQRYVVLPG
jgi:hypothetical protein